MVGLYLIRGIFMLMLSASARSLWLRTGRVFPGQRLRLRSNAAHEPTIPGFMHYVVPYADHPDNRLMNEFAGGFNAKVLNRSNGSPVGKDSNKWLWAICRGGVQLDSVVLEEQYLGKQRLSDSATATRWKEVIEHRMKELTVSPASARSSIGSHSLDHELHTAINIVQRSAYIIRAIQQRISNSTATSSTKMDNTPVTVADFAVQAFIIDALNRAFPSDLFIAEEDSATVRSDRSICESVLSILQLATGDVWTADRLYNALDKGGYSTNNIGQLRSTSANRPHQQRLWILDPIDGTKGFLRGEHCCTALGLLVNGKVELSVLGCPNINVLRLLQGTSYDKKPISYIDSPIATGESNSSGSNKKYTNDNLYGRNVIISHPDSGSVYYAVTNQGAFARTLSMPTGAAFEVSVSEVSDATKARLCESAEAQFGDRETSSRVAAGLGIQSDFLRIDGMCKHCVVGAGAAEGTLRLPPKGYREKIWDHVAGDHFVREAGGLVTDLRGRRLDYTAVLNMATNAVTSAHSGAVDGGGAASAASTAGDLSVRELSAEVEGVVVANRRLHSAILQAVVDERKSQAKR